MNKEYFGKSDANEKIDKYTVSNDKLSLSVIEYGARIQSLKFCGQEVILGYDRLEDYIRNGDYFGAVVGRCANRVENGRFTLSGKVYELSKNEGVNTLHGGFLGLHGVKWKGSNDGNKIVMEYFSKDGEEGFPGNLSVKVVYTLYDDGIGIEYFAESDKDTPVNITNHSYFNLSGAEYSIESHSLTLDADGFMPIRAGYIPTGELRPVENTPFDFRKPKRIDKEINFDDEQLKVAGGYDHNFAINGEGYRRFAELYSDITGISMDCYTDMPGVQFYSGNLLNDTVIIRGGQEIHKRYGLCLETQYYPNSVNLPQFPSCILKAGEKYKSRTDYRFSRK